MFEALGRFAYRYRWAVIAGWAVVLVAGVVLGGGLFDRLTTLDSLRPDAESAVAERDIQGLVSDGPIVYAVVRGREPYDQVLVKSVSAAAEEIRTYQGVADVDDLYTSPGGQIGADNRSVLVRVELAENLAEDEQSTLEDRVVDRLHRIDAPTVRIGGDHLAERAFGDQAVSDLLVGESVALVLLVLVLIVVFGGVVAAGVPLAVAIAGVTGTLLVLYGLSFATGVSDYALNIVTLLGIGLAVDYALLIVARYREERITKDPEDAIVTASARAGRAVAISGLAVAAALAGLAAFAEPLLASMALGGTAVVLVTTAIALTLVPALLAVLGGRIRPAPKRSLPNVLRTLATKAQRNPGPVAALTTLGLLLLALPLLGANFANSDARALPRSVEARQAYEDYQELFAADQAAPVVVLAKVDPATAQLRDFLNDLVKRGEVLRLELRRDVPASATIVDLTPYGETSGPQSRELVRAIRQMSPGFPVLVTGEAAKVVDYEDSVAGRLPIAVVAVVLAMLLLLFALTRSIVIPIKALLLNALTFAASLGVLVIVFQWGWGAPILRFDSWGALDLTTPLLLFVFIFGLSMDYEVFLLARIREEYDRSHDNDRAVLRGIERSGPVVTAAAVCITVVFLGFAVGGLTAVKEIGVGMAVAVILDVTVVRGLLLPAAMSLLGDLNWRLVNRRVGTSTRELPDF